MGISGGIMNIKVGDKVKCISAKPEFNLQAGQIYTVSKISFEGALLKVQECDGNWDFSRFVLVPEMKVLLWELHKSFASIVLWDGENTYWIEEMKPSSGYKELKLDEIQDGSRFTLIGDL